VTRWAFLLIDVGKSETVAEGIALPLVSCSGISHGEGAVALAGESASAERSHLRPIDDNVAEAEIWAQDLMTTSGIPSALMTMIRRQTIVP